MTTHHSSLPVFGTTIRVACASSDIDRLAGVAIGCNRYDLRTHPFATHLSLTLRVALAGDPYYLPLDRIQRICVSTVDTTRHLHEKQLARQVIPAMDKIAPFGRDDLCVPLRRMTRTQPPHFALCATHFATNSVRRFVLENAIPPYPWGFWPIVWAGRMSTVAHTG